MLRYCQILSLENIRKLPLSLDVLLEDYLLYISSFVMTYLWVGLSESPLENDP